MDVELVVVDDAEKAAAAAAEQLVEVVRRGGGVALAGGSTPGRAYELAAAIEPDWRRAELWLGDERCVPPEDERSNAGLVRSALLDRLDGPPPAFHTVRTELPPEEAAAAYDDQLARSDPLALALLGLGPDGHTASLFPSSPALEEREHLVVAAAPGLEPWVERVTMTLPAFAAAAVVVFLAVGAEKAEAVRRAFVDPPSRTTPASLVRSTDGRTLAILDAGAASLL
jgi:6-phosphogluconolactonase